MRLFNSLRLAYFEEIDDDPAVQQAIAANDWVLMKELDTNSFFETPVSKGKITHEDVSAKYWALFDHMGNLGLEKDQGQGCITAGQDTEAWYNSKLDMIFFIESHEKAQVKDVKMAMGWISNHTDRIPTVAGEIVWIKPEEFK